MAPTRMMVCVVGMMAVASASAVEAGHAAEVTITLYQVTAKGPGRKVGEVRFEDHRYGLLITPKLRGLTSGPHGAHIHEKPDCGPSRHGAHVVPGGAAGGHYDPKKTGRHEGPYGDGHLGDLPNLVVEKNGRASIPVLAPRLRVADIRGRSLMLHAGADRYRHHGAHIHGKGGMRMYCGVIR